MNVQHVGRKVVEWNGWQEEEGEEVASLFEFTLKPVIIISPEVTVREAASLIKEKNLGCLVIVEDNFPVGILTDRDMTTKVVAEAKGPHVTRVQEKMSQNPGVLRQDPGVFEALEQEKDKGARRFPIADSGVN